MDKLSTIEKTVDETSSVSLRQQEISKKGKLQKLLDKISLQENDLSLSQSFLMNPDLQPVLDPEDRPWGWMNFVFLWIAESFNVNTWQIASTGVQAGLSWWETWISVWLGYGFLSMFLFISQRVGSHYHISFPVATRTSFGTFGSIWPILNRVVMAIVWYSVQSWIGGQCVQLVLKSIFGANLDTRIHNSIPNSGTTTFEFLSFFIFCFISLPFIYCRPQKIRHLFTVKAYLCSTAGIAFLIWTLKRAGGLGPVMHKRTELTQSEHAWAFIKSTMNSLANFSTFIVNAPDFSRLAKSPGASALPQLIAIPTCFALTSLIGILASSASGEMYGEIYWSPLDLLNRYVESATAGDRAGVFFIALAFVVAQVGTNISANSISAGTDGSALLPKYINIRRGGFICAMIGFCVCPWNLLSSSNNFTTYLSAYTVFLSAIAGVVAADYTVVRRGYVNVFHLFSNSSESNYSYNKIGVNWRAYAAYICGILPNIVGFVGAVGKKVPKGATYIYNLSFFAGYVTSFVVYCVLCYFFPVKGIPEPQFLTKRGWYEETFEYKLEYFNADVKKDILHDNEYVKESLKFVH